MFPAPQPRRFKDVLPANGKRKMFDEQQRNSEDFAEQPRLSVSRFGVQSDPTSSHSKWNIIR
jgi:hypothetical protein